MIRACTLAVTVAATLIPLAQPSARESLIDGHDPQRIVDLLRQWGHPAQLARDERGDPLIESEIEGSDYTIRFYLCTAQEPCRAMTFHARFDPAGTMTLEQINAWNRGAIAGTAHLDETMAVHLEYFVNLDGGVSARNIVETLNWWGVAVQEFKHHALLGASAAATETAAPESVTR